MNDTAGDLTPDRYMTFIGMDYDGNAGQIVEGLRDAMSRSGVTSPPGLMGPKARATMSDTIFTVI